jgi:Fic family protein
MDRGALLCDPEQKAALEARNGVEQIDYITELVGSGIRSLRESHVLELQQIAVRDVYPCGGRYRDARKNVFIQNSRHVVPHCSLVPSLVRDAVEWVNSHPDSSALERAAYAQW